MERQELLELLSQPEHQSEVCGLLSGSPEVVRIAVPCSMLSKGVSGAGSRVLVKATRAKGPLLAVDAGQWWRGAPNSPVWLDYRQLLQHANVDALRTLHRKLAGGARGRSLARAQSVPSRIFFDQLAGGSGHACAALASSSPNGGSGAAPSSLRRTSSGDGLPPTGGSFLRRTSSGDVPTPGAGSSSSWRHSRQGPRAGASTLHRLSASGLQRAHSLPLSAEAQDAAAAAARTPAKQREPSSDGDLSTPEAGLLPPFSLPYEDSALMGAPVKAGQGSRRGPCSPGSPRSPVLHPAPSWESSAASATGSAGDGVLGSSPGDGSGPGDSSDPGDSSAAPSRASAGSAGAGDGGGGAGGGALARQPTFSQPYFAEFVDEHQEAPSALTPAAAASLASSAATTPRGAAPTAAALGSVSARAAALVAPQDQMTTEELHEVDPSFHHVFVPPWAVPPAPRQQVVRQYREAGVQTGTGAAEVRPHTRASHTAEDASEHFQAFMQHLSASLPHLAMSLADMHLGRGGDDPLFVKSQFYFNSLLQLKDELGQLGQRLQPRRE